MGELFTYNGKAWDKVVGEDGKNIELRKTKSDIEWRVEGGKWSRLIKISELKGRDGSDGKSPVKGVDYRDGKDGSDASEIEIRKNHTAIQWRRSGGKWENIVKISDLRGPRGETGFVQGPRGYGIVPGGTTGQMLRKKSNNDFDTEWAPAGSGSGVVETIVAGDNVTVDSTDPANPIVSSTGGTGTSDHAALSNLDYASAGHTGFQPAGSYLTDIAGQDLSTADNSTSAFITSGDIPTIPTSVDDLSPSQTGNSGKFLKTDGTNATWDSIPGGGDMLASTYDPTSVAGDAFDMDNMAQGTTNKYLSAAELTVVQNTSGTNTGDQVVPTALSDLSDDATHRLVTDTEKSTWNAKQNALVADTDYLTPTTAASTYQPAGSYLTAETDPVFSASDAASITATDITNLGNLSGTNSGDQVATDFDIKDLTDSTSLRSTWSGKQDALGFTPENSANKKTSLADNSDTYYPTQKAVKTAVDAKQDALGFTAVPNTRTVNGHALSADVTVSASDVGLGNVDNTSDATKNSASATLTNKTISGSSNTLSNIAQASVSGLQTSGTDGLENMFSGNIYQLSESGHTTELNFAQKSYGIGPVVHGMMAGGTPSSPTAVGSGALVWGIGARPYDGSDYSPHSTAAVWWKTTEAHNSTDHGTELGFIVTPSGGTWEDRIGAYYIRSNAVGEGGRFQADFSNATQKSRFLFQSRTDNAATAVGIVPNGTNDRGQLNTFNNSDPTNAAYTSIRTETSSDILAGKTGTGTALPLKIIVNDTTTVATFDTDGTQHLPGLIDKSSGHTIIGANSTRATRFVPLDNVEVLNTNSPSTTFADVDVTSSTSANCYAVCGSVSMTNGASIRQFYARPNGASSDTPCYRATTANIVGIGGFNTGVDSGQIFEYRVSGSGVTNITLTLTGYWEYVD